jgi:uncharacterized protein (TIGR03085 family)
MSKTHLARSERSGLCDALIQTGPGAPTLCEGWLARDLAAHLFVRERRPLAMPGILLGGPLAKLTERSMAVAVRTLGFVGVVAKVRSGPPALWRPVDDLANLVEFFVHTEDVRRAVPDWEPRQDPQLDEALWSRLSAMAKLMAHSLKGTWLELESSDGRRIVARKGEPRATLRGGAQELVLYLSGRGGVADVTLRGDEQAQEAVRAARFGI